MLAEDIERIGFLLEDHYPKSWISKPNGVRVNNFEFFDGMTFHMVHNPFFDNESEFKIFDPMSLEALQKTKESYLDEGKDGPFPDHRANIYR